MHELIHGNALKELGRMRQDGELFDMVLTDPPYSSGGRTIGERRQDPAQKYSFCKDGEYKHSNAPRLETFAGDHLDQRSWIKFTTEWMTLAREVSKPSAVLAAFIDWRQLPAMTDALQMAGWTWRGVAVWDKGNVRPINDGLSQRAEFIVWGSYGRMPKKSAASTYSFGCYHVSSIQAQKRIHMTEKPLALMQQLVKVARPGTKILDPFMGSGSTIHAAELEGRHATGIELTPHHYDVAVERMKEYERNKPIGKIGE